MDAEKFWDQKSMVKKILFKKKFAHGKIEGPKHFINIFGPKKFLVQKVFGSKSFGS